MVNAFNFLAGLNFIHADIKDDALFINLKNGSCAIIDFDSGAIFNSFTPIEPATIGSLQDWLAPEIYNQLTAENRAFSSIKVSLLSDIWSVAVAIYHIFMGRHPFGFMEEVNQKNVSNYLSTSKWPNIDIDH